MPPPDDMMDDGLPHDPPPPSVAILCTILGEDTLRQAWSVHPAENVFLKIPERRLPGFFGAMIFIRGLFALVAIIKLLTFYIPGVHAVLVTLDFLVGTTIFVLMAWRATHAHAADMRERFQIEQLLLIPEGPQSLAQALYLRPLGAITRLLVPYYIFSLSCFFINLLISFIFFGSEALDALPFLGIFIAFQGPWLIMLSHFILSASTDVINATMLRREYVAVTLLRAIGLPIMGTIALPFVGIIALYTLAMIVGLLTTVLSSAIPPIAVPFVAILLSTLCLLAIVHLSKRNFIKTFRPTFARTAHRMNDTLLNHWTQ